MSKDWTKFKELLDEQHEWPKSYMFKFIVPNQKQDQMTELLEGFDCSFRPSRTGKYVSVSASKVVESSDQVVTIYKSVSGVEGLIAL